MTTVSAQVSIWACAAIGWVCVFAGCLVGWALRGSVRSGRGGMIDLTPAAAHGELDLDWAHLPRQRKPAGPPLNPSNRSS